MGLRLMEKKPAESFADAYLLGNGTLGASVYGGIACERILLNEDTLWSGQEGSLEKPDFYEQFRKAQELALRDEFKEANNVIDDEMEGAWGEAYMPMADVWLTMGQGNNRRNMPLRRALQKGPESVQKYERSLSLREAIANVSYEEGGISYQRESWEPIC